MKNNYEGVHFSKVAGLLSTALLKMNSFTVIFLLFSNIYTNVYFAEQVSLATPESISYRSITNHGSSHRSSQCFERLILEKSKPFCIGNKDEEMTSLILLFDSYCVTFLVSIIDTCFFQTIPVFSFRKFSITERRKANLGFLVL